MLHQINVHIGPDGTDDDVFTEICSDIEAKQCCKVRLSSIGDDWSKNSLEEWDDSYFKQCKGRKFKVHRGLRVALSKSGEDTLGVLNITLDTVSPDKKVKEFERFECKKPFNIGGRDNVASSQLCYTGPYNFVRIHSAKAKMGNDRNAGTEDDVTVKICSDADLTYCCENKLKRRLRDEWQKGTTDDWPRDKFGDDCEKRLFKAHEAPVISVSKKGRDSLKVDRMEFRFDVIAERPKTMLLTCRGFELGAGNQECKSRAACSRTLRCEPKIVRGDAAKPKPPAKKPGGSSLLSAITG